MEFLGGFLQDMVDFMACYGYEFGPRLLSCINVFFFVYYYFLLVIITIFQVFGRISNHFHV